MRILFVAGGTAGPLVPLLAVAKELQRRHPDAWMHFVIGTGDVERALVEKEGWHYTVLKSGKLPRYATWGIVLGVVRFLIAVPRAWMLVRRLRPEIVMSAGSYNAVPVLWAAKLQGKRCVVHQQDVELSLSNRMTRWCASLVTVTLAASQKDFSGKKVLHTGNPVRETVINGDAAAARAKFSIPEHMPLVLVLGGSSGALGINRLVAKAMPHLAESCFVLHVTGKNIDTPIVAKNYASVPIIIEGLGDAIAAADVVVTRAGIASLSELSRLGKACIVLPMPDTHQESNARALATDHAAIALAQKSTDGEELATTIQRLLSHPEERAALGAAMQRLMPADATARVVAALEQLG